MLHPKLETLLLSIWWSRICNHASSRVGGVANKNSHLVAPCKLPCPTYSCIPTFKNSELASYAQINAIFGRMYSSRALRNRIYQKLLPKVNCVAQHSPASETWKKPVKYHTLGGGSLAKENSNEVPLSKLQRSTRLSSETRTNSVKHNTFEELLPSLLVNFLPHYSPASEPL